MDGADQRLFVYGTLKPEAAHPLGVLLLEGARLIGRGSVQARLYLVTEIDAEGVNSYPGAVPSAEPGDRVHGALFEITDPDRLFPAFDRFEACSPDWPEPHEFLRRRAPVTMEDGAVIRASVYFYAWDTSRAQLIPSGIFEGVSPQTR